jgi:4-hydroxybenzoate polyprenyltransferase
MTVYNGIAILILTLVPPLVLWRVDGNLLKEILKDLRPLRILHFFILSLIGAHIYYHSTIPILDVFIKHDYIQQLLSFWSALIYAAVFAIVSNNIEDIGADKISNPSRPLVKGTVDPRLYLKAGIISQFIALAISMCSNWPVLFGIMGISLGYYLYSCPPFRLKRVPFLAKFMIGLNSLIAAITGFALIGGNPTEFPIIWVFFILVPLSLAANFIDLKDTEGDRATGIKTLPVIFGKRKAKIIIAVFTVITYVMAGILINKLWLYPVGAIALCFHLWFLFREPFKEKPVFLIYISSLFGLAILLLFP